MSDGILRQPPNPKPYTLNPKPETLNPKPAGHSRRGMGSMGDRRRQVMQRHLRFRVFGVWGLGFGVWGLVGRVLVEVLVVYGVRSKV